MSGRRELRAELESTWHVYTPAQPGTPFRKRDLEDAVERYEREMVPGEPSLHNGAQLPRRLRVPK